MLKKTRNSSLDRVFACNGSILPLPDDAPREAGGPDATMGRAKHKALECVPLGLDPDCEAIGAEYGVDPDEIEKAVAAGRRAWDEVREYFPGPEVEVRVDSEICRGTADVGSVSVDEGGKVLSIRVADWKTGHGTDIHPEQLKGYAYCLACEHGVPASGVVSIFEIWTTHREIRTTNLDVSYLEVFGGNLKRVRDLAETNPRKLEYAAGAHCRFCPHRVDCKVNAAWLQESTTALVAVDHGQAVTRETLGRLYGKSREVYRALRKFDAAVDAALLDGPIALPDGARLERVEGEREKIAAGPAIRALVNADLVDCGEDEDALKGDLPKSKLDAWAKGKAPKGKKAALMRQVFKALRDADAIRAEPHFTKKIVSG